VELAEVVKHQSSDKEKVLPYSSLLDLVQTRYRGKHVGVIVKAVITRQELNHHQNGQDREGA